MITHASRINMLRALAKEMNIDFSGETDSAYLARAVSSVPESERDAVDAVFQEIISAVEMTSLEAQLPVELDNVAPNDINPRNHKLLFKSRVVVPLTYATSDGRGWEMGFSYGKKLIVPIVMPKQKINTPSLRLPFQIPVVFEGKDSLAALLRSLMNYQIHLGKFEGNYTVIGSMDGEYFDLRKEASKHLTVIPYVM
jgi:hypothetical protein